jgi:metal-responsive CopG/Arc/MetJ family transcriptional regulator
MLKDARLEIMLPNKLLVNFKTVAKEKKITMSLILRNAIEKEISKHDKNKNKVTCSGIISKS